MNYKKQEFPLLRKGRSVTPFNDQPPKYQPTTDSGTGKLVFSGKFREKSKLLDIKKKLKTLNEGKGESVGLSLSQ